MANPNGTPANLKRVPKGGPSPNPKGRGANPLNSALTKLTKAELEEIANIIVRGNLNELRAVGKDPDASVIKVMISSVAIKIIQKGDMHSLDILLNRLVGKVKEQLHHTGAVAASTVIVNIPSNGKEVKPSGG